MRMFVRAVLVLSTVWCALQSLVLAGTLTVASSGMFSSGAPTTTWSAPSTSWSFSFNVSDTPVVSNPDSNGFDVPFSSFSYVLGGGSVATTPARIRFFSSIANGLLEVNFVDTAVPPDGSPGTGFAFNGAPAFSVSTFNPTILAGSYPATGAFFYSGGNPVDGFSGAVVNITAAQSSVPEPATFATVVAACCLFGWMRRGQKAR
jgi:hypothetical protein